MQANQKQLSLMDVYSDLGNRGQLIIFCKLAKEKRNRGQFTIFSNRRRRKEVGERRDRKEGQFTIVSSIQRKLG